jgi:hypothetical protein
MTWVGVLLLALVLTWVCGGFVLRLLATAILVGGLSSLILSGSGFGLLVAGIGMSMWLAGWLHFALRDGGCRRALARRALAPPDGGSARVLQSR